MENPVYTYRAGRKLELAKKPDQFVVRALPQELREAGFAEVTQVSSASTRVTTTAADLEAEMSLLRHMAPTHHAYLRKDSGEEFLITDRIIVTFLEVLSRQELAAFTGKYALKKLRQLNTRSFLFQLTDHTGMNPLKLVCLLQEDDDSVEVADHDLNFRAVKYDLTLPTDPSYQAQWHLHQRFNDPEFDPRASSRCEEAWQLLGNFGSAEVVIGFTDDGCRLDHPDFDNGKFADWGYMQGTRLIVSTDFEADPGGMYEPGSNHGTAVGGVIAAETDATHTVGAAPQCRMLPIKWESQGPYLLISDSKLLTVLNFLADKVDVMSNSWGSSPVGDYASVIVERIRELAVNGGRRGSGIVFLWAAGNENCLVHYDSDMPVPYTTGWNSSFTAWVGVATARRFSHNLAEVPGVMYVAALASTAQRSHYSNYGPGVSICAPSSNVHIYYRLDLPGLGITTTTGAGSGITSRFGGTSSACPLVAGVAGLVISANAQLSGLEVVALLKETASKELNSEPYPRTPPASYDPDTSWDVSPVPPFHRGDFMDVDAPEGSWSPWFGHGKVDAYEAVAEALRRLGGDEEPGVISRSSTPELVIPDNDQNGVSDSLTFDEQGVVRTAKVTLDITHTYIADLLITLIAPSGKTVVLHNRQGGASDNIRRSFEPADTPALAALNGEPVSGSWRLLIRDLAARDEGILRSWELELALENDSVALVEESPGVIIPDNQPQGIERILEMTRQGTIRDIEVDLDISHTYIGDLSVELLSPAGKSVFLHNRAGKSADNIIQTFSQANTPALSSLIGEAAKGLWRLKIADHVYRDQGKINRWRIKLMLE